MRIATYLAFYRLGSFALDYRKFSVEKQVAKMVDLVTFPVFHAVREVRNSSKTLFLSNGVIRTVKD